MSQTRSLATRLRYANWWLLRAIALHPWVVLPALVSLAFLVLTAAVSHHIGVPIRDPEGTLLGRRVMMPFLLMFVFFGIDMYRRVRSLSVREGVNPRDGVVRVFLERWWWKRCVIVFAGFWAFQFSYLSYRNLKSYLPLIEYRTYDQELLAIDEWMLLGHSPADLLHELLGTGVMAHVLSFIYLLYIPLVPITVAVALTFTERIRDGFFYVSAAMFCWIFGTASYFMIPSLGPFASDAAEFTDLPRTGVTRVQEALINQRSRLFADDIGVDVVNSVAGFASLHVGVVFMAYLVMRELGHRRFELAALAFLVPTIIATIYFGWHFILDDVAGFILGWLSVVCARWVVYPSARRLARASHPPDGDGSTDEPPQLVAGARPDFAVATEVPAPPVSVSPAPVSPAP